jgi:Ca2+-binding EF-hand superfamily protein
MIRTAIIVSFIGFSEASASAQPPLPDALGRLAAADANHDGQITKPELLAFRSAQFTKLDRNKDGALSAADRASFGMHLLSAADFASMTAAFDTNGDGRIARVEFESGPTPAFTAADANKDGVVTKAELAAARAAKGAK